ncbi:hypothetical protein ABZZ74_25980 [Streptomyces sp. NPDC006476]
MLALAFLAALAADASRQDRPSQTAPSVRSTEPIDLTVPEVRQLLGAR